MESLLNRVWVAFVIRFYKAKAQSEKGQGTTEYAILVGVLAVIAMIAITAFKGKISTLWTAIQNGVNGL